MSHLRSWIFALSVSIVYHRVVALEPDYHPPLRREDKMSSVLRLFSRTLNARTSTDHSVNVGAIVGGVIGGLALVALLGIGYFFYRRRKLKHIEEGKVEALNFRPSWMVRVKSFRKSTAPTSFDQRTLHEQKPTMPWFARLSSFWSARPGSPTEDSLIIDKKSASSAGSDDELFVNEKAPALPHKRVVELQRQNPPPINPIIIIGNRPVPPVPLQSADITDRNFVLAFPESKGQFPRDSLVSYDTSNRHNRRRVQIPPQAVLIGAPQTLTSKRRSRSLMGPRTISGGVGRARRSLLSTMPRPKPQQQIPSSVQTPTETEFQHGRQAIRVDALNRLLGRE
ncbi:hypothetical protein D9758_001292 [Tetrapyrgos nigripes]|uniref:Uncharacterized protein n=1 Tax=Tetrapyrgos nigripes TaxID=182062 RepID=A0A8H5LUG3_9AGAR|nr:hypothetical protein D9758_001292 [Tetrapyrgos nigripes]